ncbi:copper resistance protein CopC [Rhodococcus sp. NPDC058514]|uniref:copper resistance CopC family protein n=1 Tax=unclassified Rhodococcus (in: high G+C Gram-positive bacteria) TaxID=192944 RepID=UPI0036582E74
MIAAAAALLGTGVASAHAVATGSTPADGSSVAAGPELAVVTFNEPMQSSFATLTVVGPDGNLWSKGEPTVQGPSVSVPVGELGPTGVYTVAYRVTSADGHPVSGTRTFTLTEPGSGTPGPKPGGDAGATEGGDADGLPMWPFIVAGVLVFGGGLAFALRRPREQG